MASVKLLKFIKEVKYFTDLCHNAHAVLFLSLFLFYYFSVSQN